MQLLNLQFAILLVKVVISVLPAVLAIYLLTASEETKRGMRNSFCNRLFGVSNAIRYPKFARSLLLIALCALLFSGFASWFLLLRR